jgi:NAD(P)H-dependent FMN reductase
MTTNDPLHLVIVLGTSREGRFGPVVARWFAEQARRRADLTVDVIDVAELALPPALSLEPDDATRAYAKRLDAADAFVIVTPEYNHSYPAALKHAIDVTESEWRAKPVGFVSYGGVSGGLRAVEHLRGVFAELRAVTVRETVSFHRAWAHFDEVGQPMDPEVVDRAARVLLDELVWWARALKPARAEMPYPRAA